MDGTDRRARLARSRLYLVLEARPGGTDPSALLAAALRGGVDIVQLRDKELADDELVAAAEPFRRACDEHGALFVLNDRPELVERCGADGVHVGQGDASATDARHLVGPDRIVGLSASTVAELATVGSDADYLGVGAVFGTPTKPEAAPGGLELVRAARDTVRVPWFAIGGVELDTVAEIATAGAPGVAVVRAIRDADDPEAAARQLRAELPAGTAVVTRAGETVRTMLPQVELLEATLEPGDDRRAPAHAPRARRRLLRPRGRARVPSRRRDRSRPGRLVRRRAAGASSTASATPATFPRATSTSTRPVSSRGEARPVSRPSTATPSASTRARPTHARSATAPATETACARSTGSRS